MADKHDDAEIDLDRLESRFRSVTSYGTAIAGYITFFILLCLLALVLIVPIGAAIALGVFGRPSWEAGLGIGGVVAFAAVFYGALLYWSLAETLRLNRVFGFFSGLGSILLFVSIGVFLYVGVVYLYLAAIGAPSDELNVIRIASQADAAIYYATGGIIFLIGAVVAFIYMGLSWSFARASLARPDVRRMMKTVDHSEAKLIGGQGAFLGGGISIPSLRKGASAVRAYNIGRSVFAGLGPLVLLYGLSQLPQLLQVPGLPAPLLPVITIAIVLVLIGLAALFAYWARACLAAARRRARFGLDAVRSEDKRAPTLFLRPFHDDQVELTRNRGRAQLFAVEPVKRDLDHILVEEFSWSGPVVAIGRPGEKELPFGAARTFLSNDQWQQEALALAAAAGEIVMVVDDTPGVQWEIDQVCAPALREKTLFLIHPRFAAPDANRRMVQDVAQGLGGLTIPLDGKPIVAFWLREGELRVLRSTRFSMEAYTMALRDFFRTRGAAEQARAKADKRGRRG